MPEGLAYHDVASLSYKLLLDAERMQQAKLAIWTLAHKHTNVTRTVNIGGTFAVWLSQHTDDGQQYFFNGLNRAPSFAAAFVAEFIIPWWMQN